jgi:DUF971 family protein
VSESAPPWPVEIRVKRAEHRFEVDYDDGVTIDLPAELMRVESPSAEVQGHHIAEKRIVAGKRDVAIVAVEPVGNYAVRVRFDDGHDTGIFTWQYLRHLYEEGDRLWRDYLAALEDRGLARDA